MKVSDDAFATLMEKLRSIDASIGRWEARLASEPENEYFAEQLHARKCQHDLWFEIAEALR